MRQRHLVFPLLVVLIAGLFWIFQGGQGHAGTGDTSLDTGEAIETGSDVKAPDKGPAAIAPVRVREAVGGPEVEPLAYRKALSGLRGRLIWKGSREPIPGVKVQALELWLDAIVPSLESLSDIAVRPDPVVFKGNARTDANGEFELTGLHSRAMLALAIGLRTDKAALRFVDRQPTSGSSSDLGDIELSERGAVEGVVLDASGEPLAGASVRVADIPTMFMQFGISQFEPDGMMIVLAGPVSRVLALPGWVAKHYDDLPFPEAKTDAEGKFRIEGCRPGQSTLLAKAPGRVAATKGVRVRSLKTAGAGRVKLRGGASLRAKFVDKEGVPVAGIMAAAGTMMNMVPVGFLGKPVEVGDGGVTRFTGLQRGKLWLAWRRGDDDIWHTSGPHHDGDEVVVKLPGLAAGRIIVQDMTAQPVTKAHLSVTVHDEFAELAVLPGLARRVPAKLVTEDAERPGVYHVRGVAAGKYKAVVRADGYGLGVAILEIEKDAANSETTVKLPKAGTVRFEVVDRNKEPIAAARVYWNADRGRSKAVMERRKARRQRLVSVAILLGKTDARGVLETTAVEAGATNFFARHPAYALASSGTAVAGSGTPIRFVLEQGGHIAGTVTEKGGRPTKSVTVMAEPQWQIMQKFAGVLVPRFTVTMPDGSFSFRNLEPGPWRIQRVPDVGRLTSVADFAKLMQRQSAMVRASTKVVRGVTSRVHLELVRAPKQTGNGSIIGSVRLSGRPATGAFVQTWTPDGRRRTDVDASGNFAITGLPDGTYQVRVRKTTGDGFLDSTLWSGPVAIKNGEQKTINVDCQVATIEVEVIGSSGHAVTGMIVRATGIKPAGKRSAGNTAQAMTNDAGIATFKDLPHGRYRLDTEGGGDRQWVFAGGTVIEVWPSSAGKRFRVRVIPPTEVRGWVRFDLDALDDEERTWLGDSRPQWIYMHAPGSSGWTGLRTKDGRKTFFVRGVAPGRHEVQAWGGKVQWKSAAVDVPAGGMSHYEIVLKPDKAMIRQRIDAKKPKKPKPGKAQGGTGKK